MGIDLDIYGNGKNIWVMTYIYGARVKYLRYGISMLDMT